MKISAGEVLTLALLKRVNKAAYQFGGFDVRGGIVKKHINNLEGKTIVIIPSKFVKGDLNKFVSDFSKTMNSWYFEIEFI